MRIDQQHQVRVRKQSSGHASLRRLGHAAVLGLGVFAGLLMWSRLKIVTDTPRSAYAVPHESEEPQNAGAERVAVPQPPQLPKQEADAQDESESSENTTIP